MVSTKEVERQLKKINFNYRAWGRTEARELQHILVPDEEIYECVNGIYEGGFALLVATDIRVLLIDKKPLNFLTVEDLRFDMINEIDYSHRLMGARISIATGSKNLKFTSYNQARLRKLITHVQHCMAEAKRKQSAHQQDQNQHLEKINKQLQAYLKAQHESQQKLQKELAKAKTDTGGEHKAPEPDVVVPGPELSDYLFAQSLLAQHEAETYKKAAATITPEVAVSQTMPEQATKTSPVQSTSRIDPTASQMAELYAEGVKEIFGKHTPQPVQQFQPAASNLSDLPVSLHQALRNPLEVSPFTVAYSKLPMALRNRKFGRPSFHAHSRAVAAPFTESQA